MEETKVEINVPNLRIVYWGCLGLGVLLLWVGFLSRDYGYLFAACFFGIASRIIQAEYHHREVVTGFGGSGATGSEVEGKAGK